LEERHRQLTEELKTVEPELRTRFNAGLIPADEMNARLRVLKNELGMIDAQLKDQPNAPEPQLRIYRLEHSQAGQMASTLARVIRQANITPDDNTNSLIVNTTPDVHGQIEQLLRQLDVARTVKSTTSTSSASRTSGPVSTGTAQSRQPRPDRGVSGSSVNTRGATSQNLNAEVDELRGQVLRLNNQMQEMRALLQQLIQQEKPDRPDVRN
jgi:archaellum component FlaC